MGFSTSRRQEPRYEPAVSSDLSELFTSPNHHAADVTRKVCAAQVESSVDTTSQYYFKAEEGVDVSGREVSFTLMLTAPLRCPVLNFVDE